MQFLLIINALVLSIFLESYALATTESVESQNHHELQLSSPHLLFRLNDNNSTTFIAARYSYFLTKVFQIGFDYSQNNFSEGGLYAQSEEAMALVGVNFGSDHPESDFFIHLLYGEYLERENSGNQSFKKRKIIFGKRFPLFPNLAIVSEIGSYTYEGADSAHIYFSPLNFSLLF